MSDLAALRDRVEQTLLDTGNAIWATGAIDEALRTALHQYSEHNPQNIETYITLGADGREISLSSLTGLLNVIEVWWPYDHTEEVWPPNKVKGFRIFWDAGVPMLLLDSVDADQPESGDEVRIFYSAKQEIDDLDSATATTVPAPHETWLVIGAAGHAAMSRALDLMETAGTDMYAIGLMATWGRSKLREFTAFLFSLREKGARRGPSWGPGWRVDKWDSVDTEDLF